MFVPGGHYSDGVVTGMIFRFESGNRCFFFEFTSAVFMLKFLILDSHVVFCFFCFSHRRSEQASE